jgi:hypothetical protein
VEERDLAEGLEARNREVDKILKRALEEVKGYWGGRAYNLMEDF